ncbi:MAG: MiaB/RimO family radical SAM methylthiotransferase [Planctomycetota bacterium]
MPSTPRRFRITTLGCRVNHAETRELASILQDRGLIPADAGENADLEVVHTCSVTRTAAAKSRQAIRRAARKHGGEPEVFVTGCFVGTDPTVAANLATDAKNAIPHATGDDSTLAERFARRVDAWLSNRTKSDHISPIRLTSSSCSESTAAAEPVIRPLPVIELADRASRHIRAELRLQDGCDAHCTFCIIPKIRRTLRSKSIDDAVREAQMLVDQGHQEIVLTGIFIGAYGHETALRRKQRSPGAKPLADVLDAVAQVQGVERLRISSMEPGDVSSALLDAMVANAPIVVPHLHLPLQSGSDAILRRMNRQYRVGDYLEMVDAMNSALTTDDGLPPAITTDIICGFPGETDADFDETVQVAKRVGYLHMHVFPYSPRDGTAAARWTDVAVPDHIARARVRQLIDLEHDASVGLSRRYRDRLHGRTVRVILEQPSRAHTGWMTGRCDHYAQVRVLTDRPRGTLIELRIQEVEHDCLVGELMPERITLPVVST